MKIDSNISLRDRSKVTLEGFRGLDTLSSVVDVNARHSTEMQNLICRDGVNHKRFGWKTQFRIRDFDDNGNGYFPKIQGIFDFTIFARNFLIVYAGKKFWLVNKENGSYNDITVNSTLETAKVNKTLLTDTQCKCFINGNKAYIIGCGDLLVFSGWGINNSKFEIRRVVGNEDTYIPTTTENIGCEEDGTHYTRISAEEKNLLSPYIKNTLFGRDEMSGDDKATYYLDKVPLNDIEISVKPENKPIVTLRKVKVEDEEGNTSEGYHSIGSQIRITTGLFAENIKTEKEINAEVKKTTFSTDIVETYQKLGVTYIFPKAMGYNFQDYVYKEFGYNDDIIIPTVGIFLKRNGYYAKVTSIDSYNRSITLRFNNTNVLNEFVIGMTTNNLSADYKTKNQVDYGEGIEKTYTTETYSSDFNIGCDDEIELIKMKNGDRLVFNNTIEESVEKNVEIDNIAIRYSEPTKCRTKLVYVSNSREFEIKDIGVIDVSVVVTKENTGTDECQMNVGLTYDIPDTQFDLTDYPAIISDIVLAGVNYTNPTAILLSGGENNEYTGQVDVESMVLTLNAVEGNITAYKPLVGDTPNIEVIIKTSFDGNNLIKSNLGTKFGVLGSADRLFLVDSVGNTVRWSKDEDFTYFGEKSWCTCGTADKKITGMDRLNDNTLLLVKEYSPLEPSVYVINGKIDTSNTEGGTIKYNAIFTPYGYQVGMGAVGEIVNFNGDCLMVAKDGLYSVALGENMTVDSRYLLHRSRQVSNLLEKFDLSNAKCIAYNGKFYISVGGENNECFVADNKYTASFKGDMKNVVNYEWWRWTNIPVNIWGFVNNDLWFGTEDGQLCCFTENFYDETLVELPECLLGYNIDYNKGDIVGFHLNGQINVSKGDKFIPTCNLWGKVKTKKFKVVDNETRVYLPLKDFKENETILVDYIEYQIRISEDNTYFAINYTTDKEILTFTRNYKDQALIVNEVNGVDITVSWRDVDIEWESIGVNSSDISAKLIHKEPVVAKWVSGAIDLGTRSYSKTLTYITLTGEKDLANHLKYGLRTRLTRRDYQHLRANNDLSLEELDFTTLSLDSQFASSYSRKLNLRNVNFLMFYFVCDTEEDISINSVQIEYKLNKRNIGDR